MTEWSLGKNILLQGVKMMSNKLMCVVVKGMLIGAVVGGSAAYITGMDLTCKCRSMQKKACNMYKNMRKLMMR